MAKKQNGVLSDIEIPNPHVVESARDFHAATRLLSPIVRSIDFSRSDLLLPYYLVGSLALEVYLKSLNSWWTYPDMQSSPSDNPPHSVPFGLPSKQYRQTVQPATSGHDLIVLFSDLNELTRDELTRTYAEAPVLVGVPSFIEALDRYKKTFVETRYLYEDKRNLPVGPIEDLLTLLEFLGNFVEAKHQANPRTIAREHQRQLWAKLSQGGQDHDEPIEKVVHRGRIEGGVVLLDSGEPLPEETIVGIEPVDGATYTETGAVRGGKISLDWPDSLPDGTPVHLEVFGALLKPEELDPAFQIGENAISTGIVDLAANLDHIASSFPEVEVR